MNQEQTKTATLEILETQFKVKKGTEVLRAIAYNKDTGDYLLSDGTFINESRMKGLKKKEEPKEVKLTSEDYHHWAYSDNSQGFQVRVTRSESEDSKLESMSDMNPLKMVISRLIDASLSYIDLCSWTLPQDIDYTELFDHDGSGTLGDVIATGELKVEVRKVLQSNEASDETIVPLEELVNFFKNRDQ